MASQTGRRYICPTCASEFLVVREGSTDLQVNCCGAPLQPKGPGAATPVSGSGPSGGTT